jgi:2-polyprenyl-3-methyl-5-hydroxy-6-metoxy-1,4-benzoquinol methylase
MFEIICKQHYWSAIKDPVVSELLGQTNRRIVCLKHVQDAWILSLLAHSHGLRVLEAGGGFGRVLRTLKSHERWNLEIPDGQGRSVRNKRLVMPQGIQLIHGYLGGFVREVPSEYYDVVYSISVIEHIPLSDIDAFFLDHARILKRGGVGLHAIDFYLGDSPRQNVESRLDAYLTAIKKAGLRLRNGVAVERPLVFRTRHASASDLAMLEMNAVAAALSRQRALLQSVSLAVVVVRD